MSARVYARNPGSTIWVGCHGEASHTVPLVVSDEVGRELMASPDLRVEFEKQEAPAPEPAPRDDAPSVPGSYYRRRGRR